MSPEVESVITVLFSVVLSTCLTLVAIIVGIRNHKKDLVAQAITANRIEWINDVRNLVGQFICIYLEKEENGGESELKKLRLQVELYCRDKDDYNLLLNQMRVCCEKPYSEDDCEKLVCAAQYVLMRVWTRIKIEGGQGKQSDDKIREEVNSRTEDFLKKNKTM